MTAPASAVKPRFAPTCPAAQTPLYVRPLNLCLDTQIGLGMAPSGANTLNYRTICCDRRNGRTATKRVTAGQQFRSLRLSVRTPPFHGGESGSIPLGSATAPVPTLPCDFVEHAAAGAALVLSLIHISEPTRQAEISYAVFCLK